MNNIFPSGDLYIADSHLDLAYDLCRQRSYGRRNCLMQDYLPDWISSNVRLIISSLYVDNHLLPESGLREALRQLEALRCEIEESRSHFMLVNSKNSLIQARQEGKIGILISFEGIEPIANHLDLLSTFRRLGVSGVGICWARRNAAADGSNFVSPPRGHELGLHTFGYELLDEIHRLHMYPDTSHMNEAGFWDLLDFSKVIPMQSHGNARALNDTDRNSSDRQICALIERGGYFGVNAMNFTVSDGTGLTEDISGYAEHILHIIRLGGISHVGLGLDFNDRILKYISQDQLSLLPRRPFDCLSGYPDIPKLYDELRKRDLSHAEISKVFGENLYDYLLKVLPEDSI